MCLWVMSRWVRDSIWSGVGVKDMEETHFQVAREEPKTVWWGRQAGTCLCSQATFPWPERPPCFHLHLPTECSLRCAERVRWGSSAICCRLRGWVPCHSSSGLHLPVHLILSPLPTSACFFLRSFCSVPFGIQLRMPNFYKLLILKVDHFWRSAHLLRIIVSCPLFCSNFSFIYFCLVWPSSKASYI